MRWNYVTSFLIVWRGVTLPASRNASMKTLYIYIRETEMFTQDEFRSQVIEEFVQGVMISKNLQVLFENDKIIILDADVRRGEIHVKVTLSCMKKDGKLWRQMMTMDML